MKLINRSKQKGKLVIEKVSLDDDYTDMTHDYTDMTHDTELKSINVTENVYYERIHVEDNDGVYESICDVKEVVIDVGNTTAPSSLPLHSPPSPPPPPVPSSPTYNNSLSSSSLPILPSALPLQSDTTLPPPKDHIQLIPVASFCGVQTEL